MDVAELRHVFSGRIRKLREGKMNQGEFADSVGVSRGAMSYYEQESRTPDIGVLRAICEKYGVSADYMLGLIPDNNHAVSDVCGETGLYPKAARRLRIIHKIRGLKLESLITVLENFDDEDMDEALQMTPFAMTIPVLNLMLSTTEGLDLFNLLGAVIFGAKLETGSDIEPRFIIRNAHKNLEVAFLLENVTAALWANIQQKATKLKELFEAQSPPPF